MKTEDSGLFIAISILAVQPSKAQSTWSIDPAHSLTQFQVRHLMISNVRGNFNKFSGTIEFEGKNYATVGNYGRSLNRSLDSGGVAVSDEVQITGP